MSSLSLYVAGRHRRRDCIADGWKQDGSDRRRDVASNQFQGGRKTRRGSVYRVSIRLLNIINLKKLEVYIKCKDHYHT